MMSKQEQMVTRAFNRLTLPLVAAVPLALGAGCAPDPWNLACGAAAVACLTGAAVAYATGRQAIADAFSNVTVSEPKPEVDPLQQRMQELARKRAERALTKPQQVVQNDDPDSTFNLPVFLATPQCRRGAPKDSLQQK